ncbi:MAG: transcription antitermination factor NusB [Anaerovoracaceae bacterium]
MSKPMTRREARELLMKMIFQMDARGDTSIELMRGLYPEDAKISRKQRKYIEDTFAQTAFMQSDIDDMIKKYSPDRRLERIPKAELAILRLAICEIMYFDDIPDAVSVNEAVELAGRYGSDETKKFVNGVLGSVIREKEHGGE